MVYSPFVNLESLPRAEPCALPTDLPPVNDQTKLKKYVRNGKWGINQGIRRHAWKHLLAVSHDSPEIETFRAQKSAYFEQEGQERNLRVPDFAKGDFALSTYHLNKDGVIALQVVLTIISLTYPQISYCPLMAPIASLCLHFMTEEETYACVSKLISKEFMSEGSEFLQTTNVTYVAFCNTLFALVRTLDPQGRNVNNTKSVCSAREQFEQWVWWILRDLPLSYTVRIIDCYLVEGVKVLYRAAFAILALKRKHSEDCDQDENSMRRFVRNMEKHASEEKFIKLMYRTKMPSRAEIGKVLAICREEALANGARTSMVTADAITLETIDSIIISHDQLHVLWSWLPVKSSIFQPHILYQTSRDGFNLSQLYRKVEAVQPIIILINTLGNQIIGAYVSKKLSERGKYEKGLGYFGDGQTFLFTLSPTAAKYEWVGLGEGKGFDPGCSLFISAQSERLVVGGGNHEGLAVDWALDKGTSQTCTTFNNPPLVPSVDFKVKNLEVLGLRAE